jgi:parvulin-like peptidyl-prolyl isomerase
MKYSRQKELLKNRENFYKKSSLSPALQEKLFSIKEGGITTPIRVDKYVNLYLVLKKEEKGTPATYEEVKENVKNDLLQEINRASVDSVINSIRANKSVKYNSENLVPTNKSKDGE